MPRILIASTVLNGMLGILVYLAGTEVHGNISRRLMGPAKIMLFGDSITQCGGWKLCGFSSLEKQNCGEGGAGIERIAGTVRYHVMFKRPEIISIMAGTNDAPFDDVDYVAGVYLALLEELKEQNGLRVIVWSTLPRSESRYTRFARKLNERLRDYAATHPHVVYRDLWPALTDGEVLRPEMTIDGVHLSSRAYGLWAQHLEKTLTELRRARSSSR